MNEEKELLENEIEETAPEVTEEVIEQVAETTEEFVEQTDETTEEFVDELLENPEEALEDVEEVIEKASISKPAVAVISAAITFAVCVIIVGVLYFTTYNKYNANKDGYLPTVSKIAELNEMSLDEFKTEFGLPSDMSGDTMISVAEAYIPTGKYVEMVYQGMPYEQYAMFMGITAEDGINKDTPWGLTQKILEEKAKAEEEAAKKEAEENAATENEQAPAENAEGEAAEGEQAPAENTEDEPVHPDDAAE